MRASDHERVGQLIGKCDDIEAALRMAESAIGDTRKSNNAVIQLHGEMFSVSPKEPFFQHIVTFLREARADARTELRELGVKLEGDE